jgi:acetyltransferase-like isoleucine patch superfamily enzyme
MPTTQEFQWKQEYVQRFFTLLPWPQEVHPILLQSITDLFQYNGHVIEADWQHLSEKSAPLPPYPAIRGKDNIYVAEGARVDWAFIDATDGPLYIGPGAHIQDAAIVGHHNAIGPKSMVTSGTRLRTHNSLGPLCKVGGEIGQTTFLGFSNKVHEGFMGHSIIGEWCNIGAGSNTSNLKNTYGPVRLYDVASGELRDTGLQFCVGGLCAMWDTDGFYEGVCGGCGGECSGDGFYAEVCAGILLGEWGGVGFEGFFADGGAGEGAAGGESERGRADDDRGLV